MFSSAKALVKPFLIDPSGTGSHQPSECIAPASESSIVNTQVGLRTNQAKQSWLKRNNKMSSSMKQMFVAVVFALGVMMTIAVSADAQR